MISFENPIRHHHLNDIMRGTLMTKGVFDAYLNEIAINMWVDTAVFYPDQKFFPGEYKLHKVLWDQPERVVLIRRIINRGRVWDNSSMGLYFHGLTRFAQKLPWDHT